MAKEPSIELSPQYGLNMTIPICFFCNKEKNEIALFGRIRKVDTNGRTVRGSDVEAPRSAILDYEPCDDCKAKMALGITLIGVTETPYDNREPIQKCTDGTCLYPTGHWLVVSENFVKRTFNADVQEKVLKERTCLTPQALIDKINEANKGDNNE